MAGVIAANITIVGIQTDSIAAGRDFDLALANTAPRPFGSHPAPPNVVPWQGPAPAFGPGVADPGFCDDRAYHYGPPHVIPPGAWACSSSVNPAILPGGGADARVRRQSALASHLEPYTVCTYCLSSIQQQQWFQQIVRDVSTVPLRTLPLPKVPQPIDTFSRFLTYLCRDCELLEQKIWRG